MRTHRRIGMNPTEFGERLRKSREAQGLSQQATADALGVPRTAVTQMEAGNRSVSTLELTKLAKLYRRPISHFFDEAVDAEEDLSVTLYRLEPGLEHDQAVRDQVDRCLALCREGVILEGLLGLDPRFGPPDYEMRAPRNTGDAVAQGERVAEDERARIGIGNSPIPDVSELIGAQGIWASGIALPNHMSGLFLHHSSIGPAILVNASHPRGRKRFSYAHEYAHALLDREHNRISSTRNSTELVEKRANAFAATFLMPRDGVYEVLRGLDKGLPSRQEQMIFDAAGGGHIDAEFRSPPRSQRITYKDVALVAHHFGVSYQAALYRLKSLRHISQSETDELLKREEFGRSYLRELDLFADLEESEERKYWNRELRNEIAHLAIEAYRREQISRGRILELAGSLGLSGEKLLELAEAACEE